MEVILGKTAGFCFGITNAVTKAEDELRKNKKTYCLGELANNTQVMDKLKNSGLIVIQSIAEALRDSTVIIRAHGEPPETYIKAKEKNINLIDLTCPKVLKIHRMIKEYVEKGYFIIITGDENHPETIGHKGYAEGNCIVINDIEDKDINIPEKNVLIVSQTTFSSEKFDKIIENIKQNLEVKKTICSATEMRQQETKEISKQVELMIIIGGKKSSNTKELYKIAMQNAPEAICIETMEELNKNKIKKYNKVGIMAGASTPENIIKEVVDGISK